MATGSNNVRRILLGSAFPAKDCLKGIAQYAREHHWHLVTDAMFAGTLPSAWQGDGVIAFPPYASDFLENIAQLGLPCISLPDGNLTAESPYIGFSEREIGRLAAEHFINRSHRHFAWAPFIDNQSNRNRFQTFRAHLSERGCSCQELPAAYVRSGPGLNDNWLEQRRSLIAELQRAPRPTAIFAFNDCTAVSIIEICREAGLSVPEDIAVLGVGNSLACETSPVPLSSIELDFEPACYNAAALLDRMLRGEALSDECVSIRPKCIITRVSTEFAAVSDARVARALAYIAENYTNPLLSVTDVASAVGTSRRNLERCFRLETGYTIHEQIRRSRMQEASRLLRTHARVRTADVAALVGVAGAGTFSRTFRRFYGVSPQAHRTWTGDNVQVEIAS